MPSLSFVIVSAAALYFGIGLILFALRSNLHGRIRDEEMVQRGASVILGAWIRDYFAWLMRPVMAALIWARVPPDAVSGVAVLVSILAGIVVSQGDFALGGWLYLLSGIGDFLDGRLARITGQTTSRGAALDSILDRYAEAAMLIGLAWYYRTEWVLIVLVMLLSGSFLVPYIRAKGESLSVDMKVGLMQRPERIVLLGLVTALSPAIETLLGLGDEAHRFHPFVVGCVVLLTVLTQGTAAYRLWHIMRVLDERSAHGPPPAMSRPAVVGNVVITVGDFLMVRMAVEEFGWPAWLATGLFVTLFSLLYFAWLKLRRAPEAASLRRALVITAVSAVMNTSGVASLLLIPNFDYRIAWVMTRAAVGWGWNRPMNVAEAKAEVPAGNNIESQLASRK